MKRSFLITSLLLLAVVAWAQETKPNLSGTWNLDLSKSDFGPGIAPDSIVSTIDHKEPSLKITTTQKSQQGEITNERTITTDGKENTNTMHTIMMGDQEVRSTSKWVGKKLETALKMEVQGAPVDVNDSWELSEDGKVLTISRNIKSPEGAFAQKLVFNKQ